MQPRISVDPRIAHGKPCVAGTRIMVADVLDLIAAGHGFEEIRSRFYPDLAAEDIRACVEFARRLVANEEIHLVEEARAS